MSLIHEGFSLPEANRAVIVCEKKLASGEYSQQHGNNEIGIVTRGYGFLYSLNASHFLKPGDVIIKAPSQHYRIAALKNLSVTLIQLSSPGPFLFIRDIDSLMAMLMPLYSNAMPLKNIAAHLAEANALIEDIAGSGHDRQDVETQALKEIALLKLIIFLEQTGTKAQTCRENTLLDYIYQHCETKINWDALCAAARLSRRTFHRYTEKNIGMTPEKIQMTFKLIKVQEMLRSTDLLVGDIARTNGFTTTAQLSTAYRKAFLISPSQERTALISSSLSTITET